MSAQGSLFDAAPVPPHQIPGGFAERVAKVTEPAFDGATYDPDADGPRLKGQTLRVFDFMASGDWHTLRDIATATGASEASASARLRDLRKWRFGHHEVERQRVASGLYAYRLRVRSDPWEPKGDR